MALGTEGSSGAALRESGSRTRNGSAAGYDNLPANTLQNRAGAEESRTGRNGKKDTLTREIKTTPELQKATRAMAQELRGDLNRLIEMSKNMSEANFINMLIDSGHARYLTLTNQLTSFKPGSEGRVRAVDESALQKFLNTENGRTVTYDLMRTKLGEMQMIEGILLKNSPASRRVKNIKNGSMVNEGRRGGPLRRGARAIDEVMSKPVGTAYDRGENPIVKTRWQAAAYIAATGVVPLGLYAIYKRLNKPGETLSKEQSRVALRVAQEVQRQQVGTHGITRRTNDSEFDFFNQFYGNNIQDLQRAYTLGGRRHITRLGHASRLGDTEVRMRPTRRSDRVYNTHLAVEDREARLVALSDAVTGMQKAMGIRNQYRQPTEVTWLLEGTSSRIPGGTDLEKRALDEFVRTRYIRPRRDMDRVQNVINYYEIKNRLLEEQLNRVFAEIRDNNTDYLDQSQQRALNRKKALQSPAEIRRRTEAMERRKKGVEDGRAKLTDTVGGIKTFKEKVKEARVQIDEEEKKRGLEAAKVTLIDPATGDPIANPTIDQIRDALNAALSEMPMGGRPPGRPDIRINGMPGGQLASIPDEEIDLQDEAEQRVQDFYDTHVRRAQRAVRRFRRTMSGPPPTRAETAELQAYLAERANAEARHREFEAGITQQGWYVRREQEIAARRQLTQEVLSNITTADDTINAAVNGLRSDAMEGRRSARETLDAMPQAYRTIMDYTRRDPGGVITVDLETIALSTRTLGELQQRINEAHAIALRSVPPDPTCGWPPSEDNNADRIQLLTRAMAEARAQPAIYSPTPRYAEIINPDVWNISATRLRTTVGPAGARAIQNDMFRRARRIGRAPVTVPSITEIEDAQAAAGARFLLINSGPHLWQLNELDFTAMTTEEINAHMNSRATTRALRAAIPTEAEIDAARREAARRVSARQNALDNVLTFTQLEVEEIGREIKEITEHGIPTPRIDMIIDAQNGYIAANENLRTKLPEGSRNSMDNFLSLEAANPATDRRYLPFEAGFSGAYVNMLNEIFHYRSKDHTFRYGGLEGPEAAFLQAREMLPEAVLADRLRRRFNLEVFDPRFRGGSFRPVVEGVTINPRTRLPNPPNPNAIYEAIWSVRYNMGLLAPVRGRDPMRGRISITNDMLAGFLTEGIIFDEIDGLIDTAD
jgi:hypothetical protein